MQRNARTWIGVLAVAVAVSSACGGARKPEAAMVPSPRAEEGGDMPTAEPGSMSDAREEIRALAEEIAGLRQSAGMPATPSPEPADGGGAEPMAKIDTCERPDPDTQDCVDMCTLSKKICGNATRICKLSEQLPGDAWATDQCTSASASCREATKRCCDCPG